MCDDPLPTFNPGDKVMWLDDQYNLIWTVSHIFWSMPMSVERALISGPYGAYMNVPASALRLLTNKARIADAEARAERLKAALASLLMIADGHGPKDKQALADILDAAHAALAEASAETSASNA